MMMMMMRNVRLEVEVEEAVVDLLFHPLRRPISEGHLANFPKFENFPSYSAGSLTVSEEICSVPR